MKVQTPRERKAAGLPYVYNDETILREQYAYQDALAKYNRTLPSEHETRARMLLSLMAEVGESCTIDTPVHANWGLRHVHFGRNIYCNAMVSFVDDADIYIGDDCMIGAGSVVTKDIPSNVVAVGNPCRVLREIGTHDRKYFYKNFELDFDPELEHLPL